MPKTFYTDINPSILVWARLNEGMEIEQAAVKIGISKPKLLRLESGKDRISSALLTKVSEVYDRDVATFLLSKPPKQLRGHPTHITIRYSDNVEQTFKIED